MTYVVGLTGGIGSGKTTAANLFAERGVPIIDADCIARQIVEIDQPLFTAIVEHFTAKILQPNGELDRRALREIIFTEPHQRVWLENLLHPVIDEIIQQKIARVNFAYCIVVIPLLARHFNRYHHLLDTVIVMSIAKNKQIARVALRDQQSPEAVIKIIHSQASLNEHKKIANIFLANNQSLEELKEKILLLHEQFLAKAN